MNEFKIRPFSLPQTINFRLYSWKTLTVFHHNLKNEIILFTRFILYALGKIYLNIYNAQTLGPYVTLIIIFFSYCLLVCYPVIYRVFFFFFIYNIFLEPLFLFSLVCTTGWFVYD